MSKISALRYFQNNLADVAIGLHMGVSLGYGRDGITIAPLVGEIDCSARRLWLMSEFSG